jgi:hypothetical protein
MATLFVARPIERLTMLCAYSPTYAAASCQF